MYYLRDITQILIYFGRVFFIRVTANIAHITILIFNDVKFKGRKIRSQ